MTEPFSDIQKGERIDVQFLAEERGLHLRETFFLSTNITKQFSVLHSVSGSRTWGSEEVRHGPSSPSITPSGFSWCRKRPFPREHRKHGPVWL